MACVQIEFRASQIAGGYILKSTIFEALFLPHHWILEARWSQGRAISSSHNRNNLEIKETTALLALESA